jgi:hypothetical protein
MVGTTTPSGAAAPTISLYAGSYQVKFHAPAPKRLNSTRSCGINQTIHRRDALGPGGRAGRTCPTWPNEPQGLSHSRNTATGNPDQRSKVGSIQRTRLTPLGSMDPQTSEQPTLGNDQHFIYTKEHAPECMTRGPKAGRTRRSGRTPFPQQTDPQPPSNHLRDLEIRLHLLASHCSSLSPTSTPSCSHRPTGSIN